MPKASTWVKNTTLVRFCGDPEINMAGVQCHYLPRTNIYPYTFNRLIICLNPRKLRKLDKVML